MVLFWTFAIFLLFFLRSYGINEFAEVDIQNSRLANRQLSTRIIIALGFLLGSIYFFTEWLLDRPLIRRWPFGRMIAFRVFIDALLVQLVFVLVVIRISFYEERDLNLEMIGEALWSKTFLVLFIYFGLVSAGITFFRQINRKIGPKVLRNMLLGRYHRPREEERIFLFIDLKSSTTITEELGHRKYSELIKDCFADITDAIIRYEAEIYQYVGDEIVLCWRSQRGLRNNNCIHTFFHFQQTLDERADYYQSNYQLRPFFKAGAHIGLTTVTEVGTLKREVSYYGDVLNTAARIQSLCNEKKEQYLISQQLCDQLANPAAFQYIDHEEILLRGKTEKTGIKGVRRG